MHARLVLLNLTYDSWGLKMGGSPKRKLIAMHTAIVIVSVLIVCWGFVIYSLMKTPAHDDWEEFAGGHYKAPKKQAKIVKLDEFEEITYHDLEPIQEN